MDGHWCVPPARMAALEASRETSESRTRRGELARLLVPLKEAIGAGNWVALSGWEARPLPGTSATPAKVAELGGEEWLDLKDALTEIVAMSRPGGRPLAPDRLLDLPLADVRQKRIAETEAREAAEVDRRRRSAENFLARVAKEARGGLGEDKAKAWLAAKLGDIANPGSDERLEPNARFRRELEQALDAEICRLAAQRAAAANRRLADAQAKILIDALHERLLTAAKRAFRSQEKAEVWMNGKHPTLGKSPMEACVDEEGLARCCRLLNPPKRR